MKIVLDTNVIISGVIKEEGIPLDILMLWKQEKFNLFISEEIINEVSRVLNYSKIKRRTERNPKLKIINEMPDILEQVGKKIVSHKKFDLVKDDPTDNKFLDCAYAANADFIVTGDSHLLKLGDFFDTKIITPKKFLDFITHNL